ncbi:hypothetical protein NMQ03_05560 [Arthrobacter sp. DNA4]|uniref:hypothetical protein n=1 Tax=Arthrobacter sp. DNA4 TaxID=2963432 RepID=UPI0020CCE593|nr:hypothetical protein [Arthrobacter sp. DNA4]UTT70604.1 hypothetical protein NMQ03_05560 [Arthrobacter sp. DNA4]
MLGKKSRWYVPLAATGALFMAASPAVAAPDTVVISAQDSCKTFDLGLSASGGTIREIEFANGNLYKIGSGVILTWSNQSTGKTYTVNTSGSVGRYVKQPDGTYTLTLTRTTVLSFSRGTPPDPEHLFIPAGWS